MLQKCFFRKIFLIAYCTTNILVVPFRQNIFAKWFYINWIEVMFVHKNMLTHSCMRWPCSCLSWPPSCLIWPSSCRVDLPSCLIWPSSCLRWPRSCWVDLPAVWVDLPAVWVDLPAAWGDRTAVRNNRKSAHVNSTQNNGWLTAPRLTHF